MRGLKKKKNYIDERYAQELYIGGVQITLFFIVNNTFFRLLFKIIVNMTTVYKPS